MPFSNDTKPSSSISNDTKPSSAFSIDIKPSGSLSNDDKPASVFDMGVYYLLQQSLSYLLQEDNSKIELEESYNNIPDMVYINDIKV